MNNTTKEDLKTITPKQLEMFSFCALTQQLYPYFEAKTFDEITTLTLLTLCAAMPQIRHSQFRHSLPFEPTDWQAVVPYLSESGSGINKSGEECLAVYVKNFGPQLEVEVELDEPTLQ